MPEVEQSRNLVLEMLLRKSTDYQKLSDELMKLQYQFKDPAVFNLINDWIEQTSAEAQRTKKLHDKIESNGREL